MWLSFQMTISEVETDFHDASVFIKHRFLYKFNIAKVWNQFLQRIKDFIFMCNQHYKVSNSLHFHFDARFLLNSLSKILYFKLKILNDVNMFL